MDIVWVSCGLAFFLASAGLMHLVAKLQGEE